MHSVVFQDKVTDSEVKLLGSLGALFQAEKVLCRFFEGCAGVGLVVEARGLVLILYRKSSQYCEICQLFVVILVTLKALLHQAVGLSGRVHDSRHSQGK